MEKLNLNIQLFADTETTSYDTEKLAEFQRIINEVQTDLKDMLKEFKKTCTDLLYQNLNEEANTALEEAINDIEQVLDTYSTQIGNLSSFFGQIISAIQSSESKITSEITNWASTVKDAVKAVNTSVTTQVVEKGAYSAGDYTNDMISVALSASEHTRALVGDAVNAVSATGKAINSLTGMTVVDAVKTGVTNTISTLTSWLKSNKGIATALKL